MSENSIPFAAAVACAFSFAGCHRSAAAERASVPESSAHERAAPAEGAHALANDDTLGCLDRAPVPVAVANEFGDRVALGEPSFHLSKEGVRRAKGALPRDGDYGFFEGRAYEDDPTVVALQFGYYRGGAWHTLAYLEEFTSGAGTRYGWLENARLERTRRPDGSDLVVVEYQRELADYDRYEYLESVWWSQLYIVERLNSRPNLLFELPVRDGHRYLSVVETDDGPVPGALISAQTGQQHVRLDADGCVRRVAISDFRVVCATNAMPESEDWADEIELDELCADEVNIAWSERGQPRQGKCEQAKALAAGAVVAVDGALYQREPDSWIRISAADRREGAGQTVEILSVTTAGGGGDFPARWKHGFQTKDDSEPRWTEIIYHPLCFRFAGRLDCSQQVVEEQRTYDLQSKRLLGVAIYDVRTLNGDCLSARLVEDTRNEPWPTNRPQY